jgi:hypothetical protein
MVDEISGRCPPATAMFAAEAAMRGPSGNKRQSIEATEGLGRLSDPQRHAWS